MATYQRIFPPTRGDWRVQHFAEAATQSFKAGDLLTINTSGQCTIATAASSDFDTGDDDFIGIALQDATGVTNSEIAVKVPGGLDSEFALPVEHATPSSAVTAENLLGDTYAINHSAAGVWGVSIDNTTNPVAKVKEIASQYPVGEQHGWVWVQIIAAARFAV